MIKLLPIIVVIILALGFGYFRFFSAKSEVSSVKNEVKTPVEVPKSLPNASLEERVKVLEDALVTLTKKINSSSAPAPSAAPDLNQLEAAVTEVKARVAALEKATPAPGTTTSSKATVYIPLGSGGQISSGSDWVNLGSFQATVDPASYPGYTSMQLEVNMRLNQPGGTLYARLYSGGAVDSSQVSTTTTSSTLTTSSNFTLSGSKTYTLQAKSSDGSQAFIDNARIKVNF